MELGYRFPFYAVIRQVDPEINRPFGVIETYYSIDGPRSRLSRMGFETQETADLYIKLMAQESRYPKRVGETEEEQQ